MTGDGRASDGADGAAAAGGQPLQLTGWLLMWLLLKAFSNGCAAMTGVEAVSNGVTAFKEPRSKKANYTLTVIIGMLIMLLVGLCYVARAYGVTAMDPNADELPERAVDRGGGGVRAAWFYFLTMGVGAGGAVVQREYGVRGLSAHGARDCGEDYLPHVFLLKGRRLLFSHGIFALTGFTAVILIIFDGVTAG